MGHAKLSPSSAARWMSCPASVHLQKPDKQAPNIHAAEGTLAHEVAEYLLEHGEIPDCYAAGQVYDIDGFQIEITEEMHDHIRYYQSYVNEHLNEDAGDLLLVEQRVPLVHSPDERGTADVIGYRHYDKTLVVIDLKYGQGVEVSPVGNRQLQLYAAGAYMDWSPLFEIERVEYHIAQPRKKNMGFENIPVEKLTRLMKQFIKAAELTEKEDPPFGPSEAACRWCDHAPQCKALAEYNAEVMGMEFDELDHVIDKNVNDLTDDEIRRILDNVDMIKTWLGAVEGYVTAELMNGHEFPGYKLVEGRSQRKWADEDEAFERMKKRFPRRDLFVEKFISPAQAEKLLKKAPRVKETVEELIVKPPGKPTLAKESDKRPSLSTTILDDFDNHE